jgi:proton-dependent oligopeptide transporter, POT family
VKEFLGAFKALRHAPLALWIIIAAYSFDFMAYIGTLTLMKPYLGGDIGIAPALASTWVSLFTGGVSLVMVFMGKSIEGKLGIRNGLMLALGLATLGRTIYGAGPWAGGAATVAVALFVLAVGEGFLTPLAYAGVKRFTTKENASMGYAMLYAIMNLAVVFVGPLSAKVRTLFDARHAVAGPASISGFNAVNWVCWGITAATLLMVFVFMPRGDTARAQADRDDEAKAVAAAGPTKSPFTDARFMFFIFMLLPVRTLFAHQWLTMPEYVLRAYSKDVADHMEWLVDSLNPLIIFLGVPIFTALTKHRHVLTMMIFGTTVSAVAPALLCFGEHPPLLVLYFFVFSVGEALWSSRFYEYAADLAPPGRVAQFMGVASLPWFLAKATTGFYSGFVLERLCPADGPKNTALMWTIYTAIAVTSPIGLLMARRWLLVGMQPKVQAPAAAVA